jgi:hypothetical protein
MGIGRSSTVILDDDKPLSQPIEFEEPVSLGAETASVKHTVADWNKETNFLPEEMDGLLDDRYKFKY